MAARQEIAKLIGKLNSPKWKFWITARARAAAAVALARIGPDAVDPLVACMEGPGAAHAILALQDIGPPAVPACLRAIRGPGAVYAVIALEKLADETAVTGLIVELGEEGAAYASLALKKIGPAAIEPLIIALQDPDSTIRMWAAMTLGNMGRWAAQAAGALTIALNDSDADVRQASREAIDEIGG